MVSVAILGLLFAGCSEIANITAPGFTETEGVSYLTRSPEFDPLVVDLVAGQNLTVGTVEVWDDGAQLCVTYKLNDDAIADGWLIYETHWDAGILGNGIPVNKKGNPQVGLFSGGDDNLGGVKSYSECKTFEELEIECSEELLVAAHAVVGQRDVTCPAVMYGTSGVSGELDKIYEINVNGLSANMLFDTYPLNSHVNGPNGNAYDPDNNRLYYSKYASPDYLYFYDFANPVNNPAGKLTESGMVACGGWYKGEFYYIPQGTGKLYKASFDDDGKILNTPIMLHDTGVNFGAFGDIAITQDGMIYGSSNMSPAAKFWSIDLMNGYQYTEISEMAHMQLAFGSDGLLYGHDASDGNFYWIDPLNGTRSLIGSINGLKFTDLASGPYSPCAPSNETAWGDGTTFVDKGNWAMYFNYVPECQCTEQLWQIGTPDGDVDPQVGSEEFPANRVYVDSYLYVIGDDEDSINAPSIPGYIGPENVCDVDDRPLCTDTTAELNIHFELYCGHSEGELLLKYDRYGSESDNVWFYVGIDGELLETISATESGWRQFSWSLPELEPGPHTITIEYAGGGSGNGHYIDYIALVEVP